jgi:hypothetical protein
MARYRVTCTQKREKHEHIISLGCYGPGNSNHNFTESEVINRIDSGLDTFYSERPDGHIAEIIVERMLGEKFLKTKPDGERPNNLDWLPDCPAKHRIISPSRSVVPTPSHGTYIWWC